MVDRVSDLLGKATELALREAVLPKPASGGEAQAFAVFLRRELENAVATLRQGEEMAQKGLMGTASVQEVVEAVSAAELALQRMTVIRDRVIAAYQEIMRMQI